MPGPAVAMKIRRYRSADHDAFWELHNVALLHTGAHAGNGPWDDDLHRVEAEYYGLYLDSAQEKGWGRCAEAEDLSQAGVPRMEMREGRLG